MRLPRAVLAGQSGAEYAASGQAEITLASHTAAITSVAFSPNGRSVLTSSRDGKAIIWLAVDWHDDAPLRTAADR